jgi:outer membrane protein TolC
MTFPRPLAALTLAMGISVAAQQPQTKPVSLEDCLQMALQKNLDIRIAQYSPLQSALSLNTAQWAYDPNFTAGASQAFRASEGFAGIGQFNTGSNESWSERFDTGFNGTVPTGLQYSLTSAVNRQSGSNSRFDPVTGTFVQEDAGFTYTPNISLQMSQPLLRNLWIDTPRLNIQLERKNLKQSEADVENQVMLTTTDVAVAYLDLIAARESVRVQQKALELAERLQLENKTRVQVGTMTQLELDDAGAQVARSRADLITAQQSLATAQNNLKRLISDDFAALAETDLEPTAQLGAVPETFSRLDSWHKGMTMRPDLRRSQLDLEKQKIQLKFARNQMFPQLDLNGSYGVSGQDNQLTPSLDDISSQRNPNFSAGIRLTIPLSNKRARNSYQSAKLLNEQLLLRYKQQEQGILIEIDNAIRSAQSALERVQATDASRQYSDSVLWAEQKKLEAGKSTSYQVLLRQRDLTAAESQAIQSKSDYNKALARLARAEGFTLKRYGLRLDVR